MPLDTLNNGDTGLAARGKINASITALSAMDTALSKANAASVWTVQWYLQDASYTGSASSNTSFFGLNLSTGTTAGSTVRVTPNILWWAPFWIDSSNAGSVTSPRWTKPFVMAFAIAPISSTAAGEVWVKFSSSYYESGDLSHRGVGIKIAGTTAVGIYHDGTTGGSTGTLFSFGANDECHHVAIVSDGAGNITWIVDGAAAATTSAGPCTRETNPYLNKGIWSCEAANNGDAANHWISISPISVRWDK